MAELTQMAADVDARLSALTERHAIVTAVRAEIDYVHQISARSREDLQHLGAHREDVADLRRQMQELLATADQVEARIADVEARRRDVDDVEARVSMVSSLVKDVGVNLETVNRQRAVIDHLNERLANVDAVMQEAKNTLRLLSQERELAERIEQSIRQLRARSSGSSEEGRQLA
jgi:hypothetical protein